MCLAILYLAMSCPAISCPSFSATLPKVVESGKTGDRTRDLRSHKSNALTIIYIFIRIKCSFKNKKFKKLRKKEDTQRVKEV